MLTNIKKSPVVGVLFLLSAIGCKSAQRQEVSWAEEMASKTIYASPQPTSSYTLPSVNEWVCPMHPRMIQAEPGKCSICGMDLVRSDDLSSASAPYAGSAHSHSSGSGHSGSSGCGHCGG